jgi:hypothetical protein
VRGSTIYLVVLLCMINMGVQVEFLCARSRLEGDESELIENLHDIRGKRNTQPHRSII